MWSELHLLDRVRYPTDLVFAFFPCLCVVVVVVVTNVLPLVSAVVRSARLHRFLLLLGDVDGLFLFVRVVAVFRLGSARLRSDGWIEDEIELAENAAMSARFSSSAGKAVSRLTKTVTTSPFFTSLRQPCPQLPVRVLVNGRHRAWTASRPPLPSGLFVNPSLTAKSKMLARLRRSISSRN